MIYIQVLPLYYMKVNTKKRGEDGMYFSINFRWLLTNLEKQEVEN